VQFAVWAAPDVLMPNRANGGFRSFVVLVEADVADLMMELASGRRRLMK
jgi:hypothetical protein